MSAIEVWKQRVAAHHAQSAQVRGALGITATDIWEPLSLFFKADPHRTDDFEVDRLAREVNPSTTLLDVGGGAGRFALPLALRCHHVTVVEPSPGMGESLRQLAAEAGIENVSIVAKRWQEAEVEPADVVLSAHVLYMIENIRLFVAKMVAHARQKVALLMFMRSPLARYAPFWRRVHGEDKRELPGAGELMQVLWEMDIYPDLAMFEPRPPRAFKDWQTALETLRRRLHVRPESAKDARLRETMQALLSETPGGYVMKEATPERLALISWQPK